jgi:hypothetical protein
MALLGTEIIEGEASEGDCRFEGFLQMPSFQ